MKLKKVCHQIFFCLFYTRSQKISVYPKTCRVYRARLVACRTPEQARQLQKWHVWLVAGGPRCGQRELQSSLGPGPRGTVESTVPVEPGPGAAKSGDAVRAGGWREKAGDAEIGAGFRAAHTLTSSSGRSPPAIEPPKNPPPAGSWSPPAARCRPLRQQLVVVLSDSSSSWSSPEAARLLPLRGVVISHGAGKLVSFLFGICS